MEQNELELEENILLDEVDEEATLFDFMVEDKEPSDDACITCEKYKVEKHGKTFICGMIKGLNDHNKALGQPTEEATYWCNKFVEAD